MLIIQLSETERLGLEQEFRSTNDRQDRDRLQIVLLAHQGRQRKAIAADLCVHRRTVLRWLRAYLEGGRQGLLPRQAPGSPGNIPAELTEEIRRWVMDGPVGQGLDRANWTYEELAHHLYRTHGISTSRSAMHRYCQKIGIRPYRPTYRYLRGDPQKQQQATEEIAELKKKPREEKSSC